jgi:hypothetical protein
MGVGDKVTIVACDPKAVEACAPVGMQREVVEIRVNQTHRLAGRRWAITPDPFDEETPNPCECAVDAKRNHWLLRC